jgi:predicted PP-loop superfamily ATPase
VIKMKEWVITIEVKDQIYKMRIPQGYALSKEDALNIVWNMFKRMSTNFKYEIKEIRLE